MSDNDFDAELLALANDDSGSESETPKAAQRTSLSRSPEPSSTTSAQKSRGGRASKGASQSKNNMGSRTSTSRRKAKDDSDEEEGQASSAESLGSGAMSESDDDDAPAPKASAPDVEDGPLYPIEGKFTSERDRTDIMSLPEVRREQILAERAAEVDRQRQVASLQALNATRNFPTTKATDSMKKRKAGTAELEDSPRKLNRAKVRANENLDNYKRQRDQKNEQRRRNEDKRRSGFDEAANDDALSEADAEGDSDVEWDEPARKVAPVRDEPPPELRDYERIRVGRTNFAKVCFYPGFDDAIRGCFCRVSIGLDKATGQNVYRMTQIKGFSTGRPYTMEGPNGRPFQTDQYLIVTHGKAEKEWPFAVCSDGRFTDREYEHYKKALITDALRLPVRSFLSRKCDDISQLLNHRWTNEEIEEKLRRSGVLQMQTAGQQRDALNQDREKAILNEDEASIARIDQELAALNGSKPAISQSITNGSTKSPGVKVMTQQERLAALNRANRVRNQEEIRKAQLAEKKAQKEAAAAVARGEAPSSKINARVRTRAKFNFDVGENKPKAPSSGGIDDLFGEASDFSRAGTPGIATPTKKPAAPPKSGLGVGGHKKMKQDDLMAAMDFGIDIDI